MNQREALHMAQAMYPKWTIVFAYGRLYRLEYIPSAPEDAIIATRAANKYWSLIEC